MKQFTLLLTVSLTAAYGQLVSPQQIPNTGNPPVVFLNGYQQICSGANFSGTFGIADQVLQASNRPSVFFNNCDYGRISIEDLGNKFNQFLDSLTYAGGGKVPQVDVVGHSMGGLIVRSYLAGKQPDGSYLPPATVKIRKAVFLGVPNAGSNLATLAGGIDVQLQELSPGSPFLFDLATWNQNKEDFRGVEVVSVLGNAGNSRVGDAKFTDSTVSLTSGSIEQWLPGHTRILNDYCHIAGSFAADLVCSPSDKGIAAITGAAHPSAKIMTSFFSGTDAWKSEGVAPAANDLLSSTSGILLEWRDKDDQALKLASAAIPDLGTLSIRSELIAYRERVPARALQIAATLASQQTASASLEPVRSGTSFAIFKPGPFVGAAIPSAQAVTPGAVAPGMFVSLYGTQLATATAQAPGLPYPSDLAGTQVRIGNRSLPLHYASPGQVNVVMPDDIAGIARLTVLNSAGQSSLNVIVEPAVPALFAPALNAVTGALITPDAPLRPGDYVSLYLTGLGATEHRADGLDWAVQQPQVTVGDKPCAVTYAGRAPSYVGLDQINCALAADVPGNPSSTVMVRSGNRVTTSVLPVR